MNIVSYGGGTNSTAMLIECAHRKIKIDLILFADTGAEKPHTYQYVKTFSKWLVENGLPEIITVKARASRHGGLEQYCLHHKQLPSVAYGFKSCSIQFKIEPADEYIKKHHADEYKAKTIVKYIGFDAGEPQRMKDSPDEHYTNYFPLIEWDIDRDECLEIIDKTGLCKPGKSACYFCPSSIPSEIRQLKYIYPDLAERAVIIENNANLTTVKGLGRNWAWADLLATDDMFADDFAYTPELLCDCYDG